MGVDEGLLSGRELEGRAGTRGGEGAGEREVDEGDGAGHGSAARAAAAGGERASGSDIKALRGQGGGGDMEVKGFINEEMRRPNLTTVRTEATRVTIPVGQPPVRPGSSTSGVAG